MINEDIEGEEVFLLMAALTIMLITFWCLGARHFL